MGNKKAKIMKIDGQIFKIKMPARAMDVLKDYPSGHVLLESQAVQRYGIRAPQLQPEQEIKPGKIYFLVQMPKFPKSDSDPVRIKIRLPRAGIEKITEQSRDEAEAVHMILNYYLQNSSY